MPNLSGKIFMLQENNRLVEMEETFYESESLLQKLLDDYPNLLAGEQINQECPRRWISISREFGVPSEAGGNSQWYLDNFFIDQDATPTFVEVKRSTDTRIRREVVGQMLDYAANATSHWKIETIKECFIARCLIDNKDPDTYLAEFIDNKTDDEYDLNKFWTDVADNLKNGKIRMLFVADKIPTELQRIIEFLNDQMQKSEILGIEIKQFLDSTGKIKTMVPKVIGLTAQAIQRNVSISKFQWDEETYMQKVLGKLGNEACEVYEDIYRRFVNLNCRIWWGKGSIDGSFYPCFDGKESYQLFGMYSNGFIEIPFQYYKEKGTFKDIEKRREFMFKINELLNTKLSESKLSKRPSISWTVLKTEKSRQDFMDLYTWFIGEVNTYESNAKFKQG